MDRVLTMRFSSQLAGCTAPSGVRQPRNMPQYTGDDDTRKVRSTQAVHSAAWRQLDLLYTQVKRFSDFRGWHRVRLRYQDGETSLGAPRTVSVHNSLTLRVRGGTMRPLSSRLRYHAVIPLAILVGYRILVSPPRENNRMSCRNIMDESVTETWGRARACGYLQQYPRNPPLDISARLRC